MSNSSAHTEDHNPFLAHHFQSMEQQEESSVLGMWLFLAQEIMFFGGLFLAYAVMRAKHFDAWVTGSHSLDVSIGAINTIILLLSSFSVAMAVYYTQTGKKRQMISCLFITMGLGIAFLVIKWFFEYMPKISAGVFPGSAWAPEYGALAAFPEQGNLQLFFYLYYVMTGMHALHMIVGFGILAVLIVMAYKDKFGPRYFMPVMLFGLYWHFVDIVWVFLFPLFYLVA